MSDAQPLNTQADRLAAAKAAQAARERAIDANGVKRGRALEREEIAKAAGVATLEEISLLAQVRFEHEAKLQAFETRWEREEAKHGWARFWQGSVFGIVIGAALTCVAVFTMQGVIWDTATQAFREQAMTGAMLSGGAER